MHGGSGSSHNPRLSTVLWGNVCHWPWPPSRYPEALTQPRKVEAPIPYGANFDQLETKDRKGQQINSFPKLKELFQGKYFQEVYSEMNSQDKPPQCVFLWPALLIYLVFAFPPSLLHFPLPFTCSKTLPKVCLISIYGKPRSNTNQQQNPPLNYHLVQESPAKWSA